MSISNAEEVAGAPSAPLDAVAVALDTSEWMEFERWCKFFGPRVGVLKVGLEAYVRWGAQAVETARTNGSRVFLDLKLHDIPNTVAGAVSSSRDLGVDYLTLHASGGEAMIEAAVKAANSQVNLLAVTVLTHLDEAALHALGLPGGAAERVQAWAALAARAGAAGVVCSPREVVMLRSEHAAPFLLVTPGIRAANQAMGDQKRTATPSSARRDGSDLLVIGRPLTRASDPTAALEEIRRELENLGGDVGFEG